MMSGAEEPVAIIFPQSASDGVEVLYQEFSFGRYFNQIAAGVLRGIVQTRQPRQPLRILEVGGGTRPAPPRGCCRNSTAFRHWSTISPISRRCSPVAPSRNSPTMIL